MYQRDFFAEIFVFFIILIPQTKIQFDFHINVPIFLIFAINGAEYQNKEKSLGKVLTKYELSVITALIII